MDCPNGVGCQCISNNDCINSNCQKDLRGNSYCALKNGDTLLIQRRDVHSFKTKTGVIFEEISTKHIKNDSFYIDKNIQRGDPILRKTVLEDW